MALQYNTSDKSYKITIPYTKEELLTMNQEYVNPTDIAPTRNKTYSSFFPHDTDDFYFYGESNYNKNLINGEDIDIYDGKQIEPEEDIILYLRDFIIKNHINNTISTGKSSYTQKILLQENVD